MIYNSISSIIFFIIILINSAFSYSPFNNYTSVITINDFAFGNTYAWAATEGGLFRIDPSTSDIQLRSAAEYYPDLNLTALCFDSFGNLWVGTKKGFLYKISPKDRHTIYTSYSSSQWDINDIFPYKKYLIISSPKGCSVYDANENKVIQNAMSFGSFNMTNVNTVVVYRDTLFLGCSEGVAKLDVSGDNIVTKNFIDRNIWAVERTDSAVVSFPVYNDSLLYMHVVSGVWNDMLFHARDTALDDEKKTWGSGIYKDTTMWRLFYSKVRSIVSDSKGNCWFGTEYNSIYRWDGQKWYGYDKNALTFRQITRVYIDNSGKVWCTPKVALPTPWWQGVASFDGASWSLYRQGAPKDFGGLGDWHFFGIAEDGYGNMWFGNSGRNIKRYNPVSNRWDGYIMSHGEYSTFLFRPGNQNMEGGENWGKCDAIVKDSSGYMWFSAYQNDSGSVICFNPKYEIPADSNYQYFFPKESKYHFTIPLQLNVDALGYIFIGGGDDQGGDNGRLMVFNYNGNPFYGSINEPIVDKNYKKIWDMASTKDSITWIATGQGLICYKFHNKFRNSNMPLLKNAKIDPPKNITCIEVESSVRFSNNPSKKDGNSETIETILWLGTINEGIARVVARLMIIDGVIDSIGIDSLSYLKEPDGLINNTVNHIAMDRKNGYLWIATENGLSRYNIGHSFKKLESNIDVVAYPNPYILSKHTQIIFDNIAPGSSVSIYTVDGRSIEHVVDKGANVIKTSNEWKYIWKPVGKLLPGVYFYIVKMGQEFETKKKRGFVGKILVIP